MQTPEQRQAWTRKNRDRLNKERREKWAAEPEWAERKRQKNKAWRRKNPEKFKASAKRSRAKPSMKKWLREYAKQYRARRRELRRLNPERAQAWAKKYRESPKGRVMYRKAAKAFRARLGPSYVASVLEIPVAEIPRGWLEVKRVALQLHREVHPLSNP